MLHMSLFPYRYAAAQAGGEAPGMPIMRALVLDYQDDARARTVKDEYLFGPDLLVAPVIDENTSRAVYLPAGDWLNLFTGEAVTGGEDAGGEGRRRIRFRSSRAVARCCRRFRRM